jgi:hypothetical protein
MSECGEENMKRIGWMIVVTLCFVLVPMSVTLGSTVAASGQLIAQPNKVSDPDVGVQPKLSDLWLEDRFSPVQTHTPHFHANGTHQCQSKTSIGHTCEVEGEFTDCDEAYQKLKMNDCCSHTKEGGASSGFTMGSCMPR